MIGNIVTIPQTTKVDNVTLEENTNGEMQIKEGAVSEEILNPILKSELIGDVLFNENTTIIGNNTYNLPTGYKKLKIILNAIDTKVIYVYSFNSLNGTNFYARAYTGNWAYNYSLYQEISGNSIQTGVGILTAELIRGEIQLYGTCINAQGNSITQVHSSTTSNFGTATTLNSVTIYSNSNSNNVQIIGFK